METQSPTRWGSDPEFYGPRHLARLRLIVRRLAPRLRPGARVLDVGAGAGRLVGLLAERGFVAVGIEPSAEFVAYARAHLPAGTEFLQGPAVPLPFEDGSFAGVVCGEVLEHLEDDAAAVAEIARVLEPGGVCVVTVPADPALWDASDEWAGHVRRYHACELAGLFERAGFEDVAVQRWGFPFMRLYHRWVYLPLLKRKGERVSTAPGAKRKLAVEVLKLLFALDPADSPWGIGLVLTARKSSAWRV